MVTKEEVEELLDYNPETGEFFWKVSIGARARLGRKAGSVQKHTNLKDLCYRLKAEGIKRINLLF